MLNLEMSDQWRRLILPSVLLVAFFHAGLYASYMPPWGLIDEQQHFHYIQNLAEQHTIPITGQTYLSPEIIDSLFQTRRWDFFHWVAPISKNPQAMGLDGQSYEGYQPPLFYALFAPLYIALPGDVLAKLYFLRWGVVGLSLLTVWMAYRITLELFPGKLSLAFSVGLLLALLPERAASVSRVNNDVLLEVIATAFVWVCTLAITRGLSIRRCQLLGLLLGLGVLTKTSMAVLLVLLPFVFLANRRTAKLPKYVLWTGGIATVLIVPLVARNLLVYGDPTGFSGFNGVYEIAAPALNLANLLSAVWELFSHFWAIWWKGSAVAPNPLLTVLYAMLAIMGVFSLFGLLRYPRSEDHAGRPDQNPLVAVMYAAAAGSYAIALLNSYFEGQVPVIQGRFLMPVVVPIAILFIWGLWYTPFRRVLLPTTLLLVTGLGILSLFGNLLLYFYFWSAFVVNGVPQPHSPPGWQEAWSIFRSRLLSNKPAAVQFSLIPSLVLYGISLVLSAWVFTRMQVPSGNDSAVQDYKQVLRNP